MWRGSRSRAALRLLALLLCFGLLIPPVAAQEEPAGEGEPGSAPAPLGEAAGAPPEAGSVVMEDPLTGPGAVQASNCRTGKNSRMFVGEGYMLKVTGKCTETSMGAGIASRVANLTVPDGEVRLDMKVVSGVERARFGLWLRNQATGQDTGEDSYLVTIEPASGRAQIRTRVAGQLTTSAQRSDLGGLLAPTDWNTIAVRMQGPDVWLLVNDQPVLQASGQPVDGGSVLLALMRTGSVDDTVESAVVMRNLRVSALAGGDVARAPTYEASSPVPAPAAAPAPSGEPWIGDIAFGMDQSGANSVPSGGRVPFQTGTLYAFFSWRNIPPGSRLGVELKSNKETYFQREYPFSGQGRTSFAIAEASASGGTGPVDFQIPPFEIILSLNGKEMARGWVQPG